MSLDWNFMISEALVRRDYKMSVQLQGTEKKVQNRNVEITTC